MWSKSSKNSQPQTENKIEVVTKPQLNRLSNTSKPPSNMVSTSNHLPMQQQVFLNKPQFLFNNYGYCAVSQTYPPNERYDDDEPIVKTISKEKQTAKASAKIDFSLKLLRSQVKLKQKIILPGVCSLLAEGGSRTSADIICVIDISGSMCGEKINLVRQTMKYMVDLLTPTDRLCIIVYDNFGKRLTPLRLVNKQNLPMFNNIIKNLKAEGGNIMINGLDVAIKVIRERQFKNEVTSIFLLSDGQQPHDTDLVLKKIIELPQNKHLGSFSLHSFGFGADHDQNVMSKVSAIKDGNFYYVKQLNSLDEAFVNALGGVITQSASEVQIKINCVSAGITEGIKISKVFGDKWKKTNENEYRIELSQLMAQVSKDFVFQLQIPSLNLNVEDVNREHIILTAEYSAKNNLEEKISESVICAITLINSDEEIKEVQNVQVLESYLRLKAVQAIERSRQKAEKNLFVQAQQQMEQMSHQIINNKYVRKQKMGTLLEDLELVKKNCSAVSYQYEGRKEMTKASYSNKNKCNFQFSNECQQKMLSELRVKKSK